MTTTTKNSVLNRYHIDYEKVKSARSWFQKQVDIIKRGRQATPERLMAQANTVTTTIRPGSLYFYHYDPKLKETLPYYDTFPMVFPYRSVPGGWYGINLHYVNYPERFALFKKLLEINGSKVTDNMKMNYSWQLINAIAKQSYLNACIKHYLNEYVASPFIKVQPSDWTTCMFLPVEQFVGASKEYIWRDSRNK